MKTWLLLVSALLSLAPAARAEIVERVAGVVNGQAIAYSEVVERVQIELNRLAAQQMSPAEREHKKADLLKRALDQLVDEKLIEADATALGLEVTEEEAAKSVELLAKQNGLTMDQFKEELAKQKVDFNQLKDSLKRQALRYKLLQAKVKPRKVTDEEIKAAYAGMNATPEYEVRARHIFIRIPANATPAQQEAARVKADRALSRIEAGEEFAVVARDLSDGPTAKTGGDLGYFRKGMMLPELESVALRLEPGQHSPLIKTAAGYNLVKVEDKRPLPQKPLMEVQEQLRNQLANDSIVKEQDRYVAQLRKSAQLDLRL
jgi:peptidyl-prolyl cis-trans isomerase SurA